MTPRWGDDSVYSTCQGGRDLLPCTLCFAKNEVMIIMGGTHRAQWFSEELQLVLAMEVEIEGFLMLASQPI